MLYITRGQKGGGTKEGRDRKGRGAGGFNRLE